MLRISQDLLTRIELYGCESYPLEGCGLLLGSAENSLNTVLALYPVPNSWPKEAERPVRFLISDADMLAAELKAADMNMDVVGIYHSHPDHPPTASPRDLAWATWPGYSYLITEIIRSEPGASRSWQLQADRLGFLEEPVAVDG